MQLILDMLDGNGDVIDNDRDDVHSITELDPNTVVADQLIKAQLGEHLTQCIVPAVASLFKAIDCLQQAPYPVQCLLLKALRLLHVDLLLELAIQIGGGDVHRLELEVLHSCYCENGAN